MNEFQLEVLDGEFAVWRLGAEDPLPPVHDVSSFLSMTRTGEELSIVSRTEDVPVGSTVESGWRCLKVRGPLPFEMTGVLAALSAPLAEAAIPTFVISTYDTDYLLVKSADLDNVCSALQDDGHSVVTAHE